MHGITSLARRWGSSWYARPTASGRTLPKVMVADRTKSTAGISASRESLNETKHWLRRAYKRNLLSQQQTEHLKPLLDELGPRLNAYLRSIGPRPSPSSDSVPLTT